VAVLMHARPLNSTFCGWRGHEDKYRLLTWRFLLNLILIICSLITLMLYAAYQIVYWIYIFPPLEKAGKASFIKSFFIWGQDIADIWTFEDAYDEKKFKDKLNLCKKLAFSVAFMLGLTFIIVLPLSVLIIGKF
jgi:hypothetical protein